jgi:hypothetical protein
MPGRKTLIALIFTAVLLASVLFFMLPQKSLAPTGHNNNNQNQKCGIESCHGLDIVCGANVSEVCTEEYQLGDACRKYVRCEVLNGQCQIVQSPSFNECKDCVRNCEKSRDDIGKQWECEGECHKKINGTDEAVPE